MVKSMTLEEMVEWVRETKEQRVSESLRRMNLDRPDIAALKNGATVSCKIEDLRYWRDSIIALAAAVEASLK